MHTVMALLHTNIIGMLCCMVYSKRWAESDKQTGLKVYKLAIIQTIE